MAPYGELKCNSLVYETGSGDVTVNVSTIPPGNDPTFTGVVTVPTPAASDNSTKAASTAFVQTELGDYALKASPTFTGTVNAAALTLSGNLQVNGTTTTVASSTMTVADKNIELATGAANDAAADGGGITLKGATDKSITWIDSTDLWTFNQSLTVKKAGAATIVVGSTDASGASLVLDGDSNGDSTGGDYSYIQHGSDGDLSIHADNPNGDSQFELYVGSGSTIAVQAEAAGAVHLSHNGSQKFSTSAAGVTVTGSISDSKGDLRRIIETTHSSAHTLVADDAGKYINISSGGVTFAANLFIDGDAVTIINNSSSDQTITCSAVTMYLAGDTSTKTSLTLSGRGMATFLCVGGNVFYGSGLGLS